MALLARSEILSRSMNTNAAPVAVPMSGTVSPMISSIYITVFEFANHRKFRKNYLLQAK
jgi:hypothetical protein